MTSKIDLQHQTNLHLIFDALSQEFFNSSLPDEIIFVADWHKQKSAAYFSVDFLKHYSSEKELPLIALNPQIFNKPLEYIIQVVLHEMCHYWQYVEKGKAVYYHDKQWADKMESCGLIPSDTGQPGGKRTGYHVGEYIKKDGHFELFVKRFVLLNKELIKYFSIVRKKENKAAATKQKTAYQCPCGNKVWGKPGLQLQCNECNDLYVEVVKA